MAAYPYSGKRGGRVKYIMFQHVIDDVPQLIPIIFPNNLVHALVAATMVACFDAHGLKDVLPVSAGEITIFGTEIETSGESKTLRLKARSEDAAVIHNYDYFHGIEGPLIMSEILKRAKSRR